MVTTSVNIDDDVDEGIRDYVRRKGDLKRIVNEALKDWLAKQRVKDLP